ncbi:electron transporter [Actinomadura craniellae]|uniref:Electron transporter n=1 Tax=Actinomadura craniellae TaxID=2231787 RepID=A0A365GWV9_9ACTN|nr:DM13 domain-containing protein [Actinomadura craniellae]RAY11248.1 electron transporter [Actinomadura craniellae]
MIGFLRRPWAVALLAVFAVALAAGLYLFQPWRLFTDRTVAEAAPEAVVPTSAGQAPPPASGTPAAPRTLSSGRFISHEHGTSGTAKVIMLPDGRRVLRIENLDTSDGPDLRVWLSDQPVKPGVAGWGVFDDGEYLELGKLKGNKGDQNYAIPADTDLAELTSVSIWCKRFRVSFGAAALR